LAMPKRRFWRHDHGGKASDVSAEKRRGIIIILKWFSERVLRNAKLARGKQGGLLALEESRSFFLQKEERGAVQGIAGGFFKERGSGSQKGKGDPFRKKSFVGEETLRIFSHARKESFLRGGLIGKGASLGREKHAGGGPLKNQPRKGRKRTAWCSPELFCQKTVLFT